MRDEEKGRGGGEGEELDSLQVSTETEIVLPRGN